MEFFKTKAGGLTLAFMVIMLAFAIIMAGLASGDEALCALGVALIFIAMLYSPIKVFVIK